MADANFRLTRAPAETSWSNRVLLLSLVGIFFLTFYPFRFAYHDSARFLFPLSLNGWGKGSSVLDVFLNILLFVPFGFGLAEKLRERGKSALAAFFIVYGAGALLSYGVEFTQIYIPMRDSGWGDIFSNSFGAALGALLFNSIGAGIVAWFGARERATAVRLGFGGIGVLIFFYVGIWCSFAGPLQRQTKLDNWTTDAFLAVGDSASLRPEPAWKGRVMELEFWSHAVSSQNARKITAEPLGSLHSADSDAAYRFSGPAPFPDARHSLPNLSWASLAPSSAPAAAAEFDGKSWLITDGPVPGFIRSVRGTGQFALRLACEPAPGGGSRIVSISSPSGAANLELRQYGSALAFWFRNPFSAQRGRMSLIVPHVFESPKPRDILFSFDGSKLSLFIDGRDYGHAYELGPGVALAKYVRHLKATELSGYTYIFYAIVFCPPGCLLAFAWRRWYATLRFRVCFIVAGLVLPALVLEWILAGAAARGFSFENVGFSVLLSLAGALWMNSDGRFAGVRLDSQEPASVR